MRLKASSIEGQDFQCSSKLAQQDLAMSGATDISLIS